MSSAAGLFDDAPEDDDNNEVMVVSKPSSSALLAASHPSQSTTPTNTTNTTQELRRRKRRRLFRLLKNPDSLPSFLRAIDAPQMLYDDDDNDTATTNASSKPPPPAVDDNDFLLEPPVVVIDVDEYLGLKKKRQLQQEEGGQPDGVGSGMSSTQPARVTSSSKNSSNKNSAALLLADPADEGWYEGKRTIAMPEDAIYLSEIQQWTRRQLEFFSADPEDVRTNQAGRRTATVRGRVGVRCIHCARAVEAKRNQAKEQQQNGDGDSSSSKIHFPSGAVSYPINYVGIYSTSIQKPQLHFEKCPYLPADSRLGALLDRSRGAGGSGGDEERKRVKEGMTATLYWTISCQRLGMVETDNGIRFGRDLSLEPLPFESTRVKVEQESPHLVRGYQQPSSSFAAQYPNGGASSTPDRVKSAPVPVAPLEPIALPQEAAEVLQQAIDEEDSPNERVALRQDQYMLSSFMFLALRQAAFCHVGSADYASRGKKTKMFRMGLTGFCCRHCKANYPPSVYPAGSDVPHALMHASCRSFSSSSDNLAAAMSNSFVAHLLKCPYTPQNIQNALQTLKRYHTRQMQQLPYGSQSRVFSDLWTRVRSMDKIIDASEMAEEQQQAQRKKEFVAKSSDDEEYVPQRVSSHSPPKPAARRGRPVVSDSAPVPERGPNFPVSDDPESIEVLKQSEESWDPEVNDNLIMPEDRNLVSDYVFLCMRQLKIATPAASDFRKNKRSTVINRMAGMCCINCADIPGSELIQPSGRTFPSAADNMASAFNSSLYNHFLNCPGLDLKLKRVLPVLRKIHSKQCSSVVFGSQRRFFNRVYARLKEVHIDDVGPYSGGHVTEAIVSKTELRNFSFIYRPSLGNDSFKTEEFWQCMQCRMMPFELRAKGSLFFKEPNLEELRRHFEICEKDKMSWELITASMNQLEDKYGIQGQKLVNRKSFAELIGFVVGNDSRVVTTVLSKLGKAEGAGQPSDDASFQWRNLPTNVDSESVQQAFQYLTAELGVSGTDGSDIMNFLAILNCNFFALTMEVDEDCSTDGKNPVAVNVDKVEEGDFADDLNAVATNVNESATDITDAERKVDVEKDAWESKNVINVPTGPAVQPLPPAATSTSTLK